MNFEKIAKYVCLVLVAILILVAVYNLNDYRTNRAIELSRIAQQRANNLATSLSQLNRLLPQNSRYINEINKVLEVSGYKQLQRISIPDSLQNN